MQRLQLRLLRQAVAVEVVPMMWTGFGHTIEAASVSGEMLEKQDWSFDPIPGRIAAPC